jgi:biopolymer transport protein ExbD
VPKPLEALDVWLVESNVVYRDVPFTVVADWVQQGRLLENDQVRPPDAPTWTPLGAFPAVAAYLPRPEPFRAEDRAEAMEPVELEFGWQGRPGSEEEDVDMIPLIDVSLVLLIFFMMTATVGGAAGLIPTPKARYTTGLASTPFWVGVDCRRDSDGQPVKDANGNYVPVYSMGEGDKAALADAWGLTSRDELLKRLEQHIRPGDRAEVRIKGNPLLPFEVIRELSVALERLKGTERVSKISAEVSEREKP